MKLNLLLLHFSRSVQWSFNMKGIFYVHKSLLGNCKHFSLKYKKKLLNLIVKTWSFYPILSVSCAEIKTRNVTTKNVSQLILIDFAFQRLLYVFCGGAWGLSQSPPSPPARRLII